MAVGLRVPGALERITGITIGVGAAGIRKRDRNDVAVLLCEPGTQAAACFTRNRFQAAPVRVAREYLAVNPRPRALVINSGNANAGTGDSGIADARAVCGALAASLGVDETEVLPFSTGVIGQRLPVSKITDALPRATDSAVPDGWLDAARAIMTTDTLPKGGSRRLEVKGRTATLTGIVKGSGMIHPDMATMLAFIATDAAIQAPDLQACLERAVNQSFNRSTVDGDTSTNDACVLLATGQGPAVAGDDLNRFQAALDDLCRELAQAVVRDGEGATKFVEIAVSGAASEDDARTVALTVAHSPLVKTALFASDANWGRLLAAVGRAPVDRLEVDKVSLSVNGCRMLQDGAVDPDYTEDLGAAAMAPEDIVITIELGIGAGECSVWTSDLSHEYVRINAEYRT